MTSIEGLEEKFKIYLPQIHQKGLEDAFQQAKLLHKQEIINTWYNGYINQSPMIDEENCGEHFYQETFVSKGSDDTPMERKLLKSGFVDIVPKQETLYTEEQVSRAIALYLEGHSFSEIIKSLKQPKKD